MGQDVLDFVEAEEDLLIDFQFLVQDVLTSKGISKSELAKRTGISKSRLSQILSAEANPSVKTFARLFHALGVKVEPRIAPQRSDGPPIPVPQRNDSDWKIGHTSEAARAPVRELARARASDWMGASNDNYMSVDGGARTLMLKAA
jgi:transcriptional regulator with XRE-family HTH domain